MKLIIKFAAKEKLLHQNVNFSAEVSEEYEDTKEFSIESTDKVSPKQSAIINAVRNNTLDIGIEFLYPKFYKVSGGIEESFETLKERFKEEAEVLDVNRGVCPKEYVGILVTYQAGKSRKAIFFDSSRKKGKGPEIYIFSVHTNEGKLPNIAIDKATGKQINILNIDPSTYVTEVK